MLLYLFNATLYRAKILLLVPLIKTPTDSYNNDSFQVENVSNIDLHRSNIFIVALFLIWKKCFPCTRKWRFAAPNSQFSFFSSKFTSLYHDSVVDQGSRKGNYEYWKYIYIFLNRTERSSYKQSFYLLA